jgi:hypothetical protein
MPEQLDIFTYRPRPSKAFTAANAANQSPMPCLRVVAPQGGHSIDQSGRAANYPFYAGFKDATTSRDAARLMEMSGKSSRMRALCLNALDEPRTPKELADCLCVDKDHVRPRCTELLQQGLIVRTGEKRDGQHVLVRVTDG